MTEDFVRHQTARYALQRWASGYLVQRSLDGACAWLGGDDAVAMTHDLEWMAERERTGWQRVSRYELPGGTYNKAFDFNCSVYDGVMAGAESYPHTYPLFAPMLTAPLHPPPSDPEAEECRADQRQ